MIWWSLNAALKNVLLYEDSLATYLKKVPRPMEAALLQVGIIGDSVAMLDPKHNTFTDIAVAEATTSISRCAAHPWRRYILSRSVVQPRGHLLSVARQYYLPEPPVRRSLSCHSSSVDDDDGVLVAIPADFNNNC